MATAIKPNRHMTHKIRDAGKPALEEKMDHIQPTCCNA
jgi:hypothetical protein